MLAIFIKTTTLVRTKAKFQIRFNKIKLKPNSHKIFLLGSRPSSQILVGEDAIASFKECFTNLFFDSSREKVCHELCPRIASLVAGTLAYQRNCFLGLGVQGIGKSQFMIALGQWMVTIGNSCCAFYYEEMGHPDTQSLTIRKLIHEIAVLAEWKNVPAEPWKELADCLKWLRDENKKILLVMDEFDKAYRRRNEVGLYYELCCIGGFSDIRPIMIILLGSSSYLTKLCFFRGGEEDLKAAGYKGVEDALNLNSSKFVPLRFSPIVNIAVTKNALECLGITVSAHYDLERLCKVTQGQIRDFLLYANKNFNDNLSIKSFNEPASANKILQLLWENVSSNCTSQFIVDVMSLKVEFTEEVQAALKCSLDKFIDHGILISDLHDCADSSLIRFDRNSVGFNHPYDLDKCMTRFSKTKMDRTTLTVSEKVSLLYPNNSSSTNELNEILVAQSLCEKGLKIDGLGRFTFKYDNVAHGYVDVVRSSKPGGSIQELYNTQDLTDIKHLGSFCKGLQRKRVLPATLRKEFLDEFGANLIAVFKVFNLGTIKFIVFRVLVKLGLSNTSIDTMDFTPISCMKSHEKSIAEALGHSSKEIIFVNILWTSHPTKAVNSHTDTEHTLVIDNKNMLKYWSKKVVAYVKDEKLVPYGYPSSTSNP